MFTKNSIIFGLILILLIVVFVHAQEKPTAVQVKQQKTLDALGFNQSVAFALLAVELNYQVKERLLPNVHKNDYFRVVLMTAKRQALSQMAAIKDTTNEGGEG